MPASPAIPALLLASALLVGLATTSDAAEGPPGYRVYSETLLVLDRWQGTRTVVVDRTDMRQRLRLDAWHLGTTPERGPRLDLVVDLELGSDLGPPSEVLDGVPDARRVVLDLYAAELRLDDAFGVLDARVGRQRVFDALGFAAFDGASAELWLMPHVSLRVLGGLEVRRAWTSFGPDLYETDGTRLRDTAGGVIGAGLRTRDLGPHAVDLAWRRALDDGGTLRDEIGASAILRPLDRLDVLGSAVFDLLFMRPSELRAGFGWRVDETLRLDAEWLRLHPTFAADTLWSAFVTEAHHGARLAAHQTAGRWRSTADAELRVFDGGSGSALEDDLAAVGGLRIERAFTMRAREARVGVDGRLGTGYGGDHHHVDVFTRVPVGLIGPNDPVWLRLRVGAAFFDVPDRDAWDGWTGWLAATAEWFAARGVRLDGVVEGHARGLAEPRIRVMARMAMEDVW